MQINSNHNLPLEESDSEDWPEVEIEETPGELSSVYTVAPSEAGQRLDVYVTAHLAESSRAEAQRLITLAEDLPCGVRVNERREKANFRLRAGDVVSIERPEIVPTHMIAEAIPIPIVYEDHELLVVDKPRGMVVHPAPGAEHGTLANAVLAHVEDLSGIGGAQRPGIVHRLDKDTGGLLVVAKTDAAHRALQAQIQARTAERRYLALVWGAPHFTHATVDAAIGRHPIDRKKMAVITDPHQTSRSALTELTVKETLHNTFALLEAKLQTGRTHQIRVHCAYIQHPVVGDPIYGGIRKLPGTVFAAQQRSEIEQCLNNLHGQALHAYSLAFDHPRTGERLAFTVPLPPAFQALLDTLRGRTSAIPSTSFP